MMKKKSISLCSHNKWCINAWLLKNLDVFLDKGKSAIAETLGVSYTVFTRWVNTGELPLHGLLKICNTFHIHANAFIGTMDSFGNLRMHIVDDSHPWKYISFDNNKFGERFGECGIHYKTLLDATGSGWQSMQKWMKLDKEHKAQIKVGNFLKICNAFQFEVSDFVNDPCLMKLGFPAFIPASADIMARMNIENHQLKEQIESLRKLNSCNHFLDAGKMVAEEQPKLI